MPFGYQPYNQPYNQPYQQDYQMYGHPNYTQYGQQSQRPPMQVQNGLNRVTGIEGARAFQVNPNSVVALFDDTQDVFYVKSTDSGGFPTIRGYRFTPIEDAPQAQPAGLTRADVEQIVREEMQKHEQQFISRQYTVPADHRSGTDRGNTAGYDAGIRELHAGNAGAQSGSGAERNAEQQQTPSGGASAGTGDGTAV